MRAPITLFVICLATGLAGAAEAAAPRREATVKEYTRVFATYPYSDPDPIASMSRFYPYFRFDGFTAQPVDKKWKVVELSNDYLQVLILPEIGGKVWAAIEKTTGKSFIYFNQVVKFRDVGMRGPWTSGGMEANYGIMGHTPNCFSPVDYLARRNPDGSASCIIGVLDLLTRSTWRLEINLPADQAVFTTRSLWHNGSGIDQPYYTWMNVGIKSAGNLQFVNPGTCYIDHDGKAFDWPIDRANGRDLSWYEQNNFGSYKSYHVMGRFAEFFGGYWHKDDFGMARCSTYGEKPGRKIWIWGLSREGMIWENLLTDSDGQYVEVQSGRLFNQAADRSSLTPFKHKDFPPYATDTWTEYWLPVKGIKGFVSASPWGALNVDGAGTDRLLIRISPARPLRDKLQVFDGGRLLHEREVALTPMQAVEAVVRLAAAPRDLRVCVGGDKLQYVAGDGDVLSRPREAPAGFDWESAQGLYLRGKESVRERAYVQATDALRACLTRDPNYLPALVELASLANRRGDPAAARGFARQALSIDTYDPAANYQFGTASAALGRTADALEALSITALSVGWRSAGSTALAEVYLREGRHDRALGCAESSLDNNRRNLDGLQLQAVIHRLRGDRDGASAALTALLALDPLNHCARFEKYRHGQASREDFSGLIRNEMPHETYLELAAWYHRLGLDEDAAKVLDLAPPTAEGLYWLAYLRRDAGLLVRAGAASPEFAFPFRPESIPVFEWACGQSRAWQPRYYLALIRWYQGELGKARELLAACGDEPRFGPFYAARAQVNSENATRDLKRAIELDPGQWRYGSMLVKDQIRGGHPAAALAVAADSARRFPANTGLALLHAKALVLNGRYQEAAGLLSSLDLLPSEGVTDARALFHEAHLMLAVERMKANAFDQALRSIETARQWPEKLGSGKPYSEDVDERLEDWLVYQCHIGLKAPEPARQALDKILAFQPGGHQNDSGQIIRALALKQSGRAAEALVLVQALLKQAPGNELARWAAGVLAGLPAPLPTGLKDINCRVLAALPQ